MTAKVIDMPAPAMVLGEKDIKTIIEIDLHGRVSLPEPNSDECSNKFRFKIGWDKVDLTAGLFKSTSSVGDHLEELVLPLDVYGRCWPWVNPFLPDAIAELGKDVPDRREVITSIYAAVQWGPTGFNIVFPLKERNKYDLISDDESAIVEPGKAVVTVYHKWLGKREN